MKNTLNIPIWDDVNPIVYYVDKQIRITSNGIIYNERFESIKNIKYANYGYVIAMNGMKISNLLYLELTFSTSWLFTTTDKEYGEKLAHYINKAASKYRSFCNDFFCLYNEIVHSNDKHQLYEIRKAIKDHYPIVKLIQGVML